jgi:hypothetical protein
MNSLNALSLSKQIEQHQETARPKLSVLNADEHATNSNRSSRTNQRDSSHIFERIIAKTVPAILIVVDETATTKDDLLKNMVDASTGYSEEHAIERSTIFATGIGATLGCQIRLAELLKATKSSENSLSSIIVTLEKLADIPGAEEAIRSHCPGFPIKSVIIKRGASESESTNTIQGDLESAFGTVVISVKDNESEAEKLLGREGLSHVLEYEFRKIAEKAKDAASRELLARLAPYELTSYEHEYIPPEVIRVLDQTLAPYMQRENISLVLKGGVAIAAILDRSRQVSPDIDFTLRISHEAFSEVERITKEVVGGPIAIRARPGQEIHRFSTKLSGTTITEGAKVDVDVVQVRRFDLNHFLFTFKYDSLSHLNRLSLNLPSGNTVFVCPPELSVMEKLFAARGLEQGKFDLFDCLGLLNSHSMNPGLIQRYIMRQEYDPKTDPEAGTEPIQDICFNNPQELLSFAKDQINIKNDYILDELLRAFTKNASEPNSQGLLMKGETWKRLAFVDRLFDGLSRINDFFTNPVKEREIHPEWSLEKMSLAIESLSSIFRTTVSCQILRSDLYIRRTMKSYDRLKSGDSHRMAANIES